MAQGEVGFPMLASAAKSADGGPHSRFGVPPVSLSTQDLMRPKAREADSRSSVAPCDLARSSCFLVRLPEVRPVVLILSKPAVFVRQPIDCPPEESAVPK